MGVLQHIQHVILMSHVTHVCKSWHTHTSGYSMRVCTHLQQVTWTSHVTPVTKSWHTHMSGCSMGVLERVQNVIWTSHVTHAIWTSHVTHANKSSLTHIYQGAAWEYFNVSNVVGAGDAARSYSLRLQVGWC